MPLQNPKSVYIAIKRQCAAAGEVQIPLGGINE